MCVRLLRMVMAGVALLTTASVLALPGASVGAADPDDTLATTRYGGNDRYDTSLRVAKALAELAGGTIDEVVMVPGRSWTDAVVAGPLAGARGGAVLSTPSAGLRTDASEFLKGADVKKAWLIGAESDSDGIGPGVADALEKLGIATTRVSGADRYETAVLVANALGTPGDMGDLGRTAIVASGLSFADALVAGPFAARGRHPVLLNPSLRLHDSVAGYLASADIEHVVLMGGTAALSPSVEASIEKLDIKVSRLAGASRYATSVTAAEFVTDRYGKGCFSLQRTGLARARVPFDSFSAGPLLGRLCAPLLLADPREVPAETGAYLDSVRKSAGASATPQLHVFGGDAAISQASIDAYLDPDAARSDDLNCIPELGDKPTLLLGGAYARHPAWSPDCSRIAYLDKEEAIWTANVDGSDPVRVTEGYTKDEEGNEPAWSPDGKKIAFIRYAGRFVSGDPVLHIFVVNADGSGETQLTTGDVSDTSPAWSPDGRRMVFSRQNLRSPGTRDGRREDRYLTVMDSDGRNQKQITPSWGDVSYPAWSPDGRYIAYNNSSTLAFVTPDGSLPSGFLEEHSISGAVVWSPSGSQIAYVRIEWVEGTRIRFRLVSESLDGSSLQSVASYSQRPASRSFLVIYKPSWAPDGKSILFERNTNNGDRARAYAARVAE